MQRYGQFCPVAKAAEVFAERWTPLILRELLHGSSRFSDLQRGVPLMSRTLLAQRLKELDRAGVLERRRKARGRGFEYRLTPAGEEFRPIVERLGMWGQRWARRQLESDGDYDTGLLMWAIRRGIHVDRLPRRRLVVFFEFRGVPRSARRGHRSWWLVLSKPEVDICLKDPGGEVDLKVKADLRTLTRAWLGDLPLEAALQSGQVRLEGPRELVRAFPAWLALSPLASVPRLPGAGRTG